MQTTASPPAVRRRWSPWAIAALCGAALLLGVPCVWTVSLAALRGYVMPQRMAEATTFLGEIRLREAAYEAEWGSFCAAEPNPSAIPGRDPAPFEPPSMCWIRMDAAPDGPVRFRYRTLVTPTRELEIWAEGDLDGDGEIVAVGDIGGGVVVLDAIHGAPLDSSWE